jgi:hypothetical protein
MAYTYLCTVYSTRSHIFSHVVYGAPQVRLPIILTTAFSLDTVFSPACLGWGCSPNPCHSRLSTPSTRVTSPPSTLFQAKLAIYSYLYSTNRPVYLTYLTYLTSKTKNQNEKDGKNKVKRMNAPFYCIFSQLRAIVETFMLALFQLVWQFTSHE